jgi:hypothetical protein
MNILMLIIRFVLGMRVGCSNPTRDASLDCLQRHGGWRAWGVLSVCMAGSGPLENRSTPSGVPPVGAWRPDRRALDDGWFPGAVPDRIGCWRARVEFASWREWAAFRDRWAAGCIGRHNPLVPRAPR